METRSTETGGGAGVVDAGVGEGLSATGAKRDVRRRLAGGSEEAFEEERRARRVATEGFGGGTECGSGGSEGRRDVEIGGDLEGIDGRVEDDEGAKRDLRRRFEGGCESVMAVWGDVKLERGAYRSFQRN